MNRTVRYLLPAILFFIISANAISQSIDKFSREGKQLPFKVFNTTDANLTIQEILENTEVFKSPDTFSEKSHPEETYWVQIDLLNELNTIESDNLWYLRFRLFDYATIYYDYNGNIEQRNFGDFQKRPEQNSFMFYPGIEFRKDRLFNDRYVYLKVKRVIYFSSISDWKFVYVSQDQMELIQRFYNNQNIKTLIPIYLFTGICLVMLLLTLMIYLYSRRFEFLCYALYVLFLFLYLTPDIFKLHDVFFGGFSLLSYAFFQIAQVVINLCYILFVIYYLNTKEVYPKLHKVLVIIAYLLGFIIVMDTILFIAREFTWHIHLLDFERLVMSIFGIAGMLYLIFKSKNKLAYFVVGGSFLYMIGALGFLFLGSRIYMISGSVLEIFIFAAGLTYKIQQEYKEKLVFQEQAFVNKTKALRAQINPHFIFNSLSSIQHLITSNNRISALKYLSKFSRLTRNILESSMESNVILRDEIKLLEDYLHLESLRFDDSFNYEISIDDNLDIDAIEVPSLIFQPFVENAIVHGLLNKKTTDKYLAIKLTNHENFMVCTIDDNGIGRLAAAKIKNIHKEENKSRGLDVTEQRLKMLDTIDVKTSIEIMDKISKNGMPAGTKVIIKIPIN